MVKHAILGKKAKLSLDNKWWKLSKLTDKIVYKADIETNDGISETEFTSKYNNHAISFRNRTWENDLELSKFILSLKDQNKEFDIQ